ncbi:MAG: tetratricopeptide repeat protein [Bernardetiaceae bacterium]|nr:tetratricopeptide repeat protein [Bernardetiaceae bacterium]
MIRTYYNITSFLQKVQLCLLTVTVCMLYFLPPVIAQEIKVDKKLDSLLRQVEILPQETQEKAEVLSQIAWRLRNTDFDKALDYALKSVAMAERTKAYKTLAQSHNFAGVIYRNKGDYTEAMSEYFKALEVAQAHEIDIQMGYAYNNIGDLYKIQTEYKQATENIDKAIFYFNKIGDERGEAYAYIRSAEIYTGLEDYEKALEQYQSSLTIREKLGVPDAIASTLNGMGELYNKLGRFQDALQVLEPTLDISRKNINDKRLAGIHTNLAISYIGLKNPVQAQILAQEAVRIAQELQAKDYLADALQTLAIAYEKDKKFEAANQTLKKYVEVRNEMFKEANKEDMSLLKSQYDLKQKQTELDIANREKSLQQKIFIAIGIILIVMLFFIIQLIRSRKKQRLIYAKLSENSAEIEAKNKALEASTKEVEQKNNEIQSQNEELQASEEELKQNLDKLLALQNDLENKNQTLENTLQELQSAQSQLVQSEKMATLGQLVANIAHEINTPMGAIRSSSQTSEIALLEVLPELPPLVASFNKAQLHSFQQAIKQALEVRENLSSKEKRKIKYNLIDKLEVEQIPQADSIADILTEIGLYESHAYKDLLKMPNPVQTIEVLNKVIEVFKANQNIRTATERASKIIFALKNFSRQDQSGEKQKASIAESIETTLTLYNNQIKQGSIEVVRQFNPLPDYECYIDELSQVWTNLIHNAIQAIGSHGTIEVTTNLEDNKAILISIRDTGGGIPKEIQNRIFEPFFTTKKAGEGSGLGLDIVKKIIEKHEGKIWFESEEGVGTTFFIALPL